MQYIVYILFIVTGLFKRVIDNGNKERDEVIKEILDELQNRGWEIPPESFKPSTESDNTENKE